MDAKLIDDLLVPTIRVSDIATLKPGWGEAGSLCAGMLDRIVARDEDENPTYNSGWVAWGANGWITDNKLYACYAQLSYQSKWAYLAIRLTDDKFDPRIRAEWNNKAFFSKTSPYSGVWADPEIEAYRVWADDADEVIGLLINLETLTKKYGKALAMHLCISWRYCWEMHYLKTYYGHLGRADKITLNNLLDLGMPMNRVFIAHQFFNYGPSSHLGGHFVSVQHVGVEYIHNMLLGKPVAGGGFSSYYAYSTRDVGGSELFSKKYGVTQAAIDKLILDNDAQGYMDLIMNVLDKAEADARGVPVEPVTPRVYRRKKKVADVIDN